MARMSEVGKLVRWGSGWMSLDGWKVKGVGDRVEGGGRVKSVLDWGVVAEDERNDVWCKYRLG